jgi:xanthine dehydrogenase accessory factor
VKSWLPVLHERLRDERALVRVVVATVRGSAPREPGACMLIGTQRIDGTIGGGHLELKATAIARQMLEQPAMPARLDRFALGATLGQCCGGAVNLWFERLDAGDLDFVEAALRVYNSGEPAVLVTLPRSGNGMHNTVRRVWTHLQSDDETTGRQVLRGVDALLKAPSTAPRASVLNMDKQEVLFERIDPQGYPLWLYGAGHVGKALVGVLADLPFQVTWIDSRDDAFPASLPAHVSVRHAPDPATTVALAPEAAYFLVMTHSHDIDYEVCRAMLRRNDFAWAGLIGSETKAACFNLRFGRDDVPAESVARLVSPIGIDGIDSKLPGAIAISVAAQLLQVAQSVEQSSSKLVLPLLGGLQTS